MIRVGIIGSNFGRLVQLPAFRADPRCEVIALAGSDAERTASRAAASGIRKAYGDWRALVDDAEVDAVAIATLPSLQAEIAIAALARGKPVFAEKPMADDLAGARAMLEAAQANGRPTMIDFNFTQVIAWLRAKEMLDAGAVGALRHVAVHWHVENRAVQLRLRNWKTDGATGGGVLGNFVSHCFHYLEWLGGPLSGLSARIAGLPDEPQAETTVSMALTYATGPLVNLSMSCASYLGAGHRVEFFGDGGTLVLENTTADYMRGFTLRYGKRPAATLTAIPVDDPLDAQYVDGRTAPVARLAARFLDAIEKGTTVSPGFAEGYRVQLLIDAARRSHATGAWVTVPPPRTS